MLRDLNMPMMAPDYSSSSSSELTWDDIPSAGPADIQSGRNVYIDIEELSESVTVTKASADKILQFIHEGFLPVFRGVHNTGEINYMPLRTFRTPESIDSSVKRYALLTASLGAPRTLYAYSDALDKPFTTLDREGGSTPGR